MPNQVKFQPVEPSAVWRKVLQLEQELAEVRNILFEDKPSDEVSHAEVCDTLRKLKKEPVSL